MASKYLNLEEAAVRLSISVEQLKKLREDNKIRAFADRGTWKFKTEDVETLSRTLAPDSGFEMPSLDDDDVISLDDDMDLAGGSKIVLEEEMGDQPTVISKKSPNLPPSSDSDVRLVVDPSLESDSWTPPAKPPKTEEKTVRDSDVRFVDAKLSDVAATPLRPETEDDSKISLKESDDRWSGISDSDVRLAPLDSELDDNGSNVTLQAESSIGMTDDEIPLAPTGEADSSITLMGEEGSALSGLDLSGMDDPGSDITLMPMDEESEARLLEADDESEEDSILSDMMEGPASGLSFSSGDSGISLDLAIDSGISLGDDDDDDGSITLAADSGISLVPDSGIGLTLDDRYEVEEEIGSSTIPMLGTVGDDDEDTSFDMPLLDDSGAEIKSKGGDTTGVVMFDDDEVSDDTMEFDSAELSDDEFVDFDGDEDSFDELSDGELDVDDDMLDDDVLEAGDDDFEDDFESGESVSALPVPGGARGGAALAAPAAEWDMLSFSLVLVSTLFMGVCTLLMYDLVRSMWAYETPLGVNGMILDALQSIIKS